MRNLRIIIALKKQNIMGLPVDIYNHNHCYGKLKGKTSWMVHTSVARRILSKNFNLHKGYIPFKNGKVSFVRLTNKEGKVRFFTEAFLVGKDLVNEYIKVKGTIFTKPDLLIIYYNSEIIKIYNYKVNRH